ncbi:hypothetical protein IAQ61_007966 [Plenodomus lingam]|uniref:Uncharacterized protein n=1 Tax=Leptosphaeria maculans (strain JN3 / isolate v23.1.3 / race Av1-4-5-6-7-8) TaxID=985895 RepID=E5A0N1_LEPMJ|nr:hypothetical protein LEMA_P102220.1 [Plenodomus lingam JN3]KAH9867374.1 hypothetical protein IAQ61_007966 [Plenodomus lingam]CBX97091.1 hypothetical protein LEMA_P102220.1 [Plenodomus lingam JN3]
MSAPANEKTTPITFGATIERSTSPSQCRPLISEPEPEPQHPLRTHPSHDSNMSSTTADAAAKKEWAADPSNPYSAFFDASAPQSKSHLDVKVHDLEMGANGVPLSVASTQQPKVSVDGRVKECSMWPSRQAVMDKRKSYQRKRGCAFFRNLTNKQRMWAKIVIALLVVAAAVGLGVGISRAVGGGVWAGNGKSKEIPGSHP